MSNEASSRVTQGDTAITSSPARETMPCLDIRFQAEGIHFGEYTIRIRQSGEDGPYGNPFRLGPDETLPETTRTDAGEFAHRLSVILGKSGSYWRQKEGARSGEVESGSSAGITRKKGEVGMTEGWERPTASDDWRSTVQKTTVSLHRDRYPEEPQPTIYVDEDNNVPGGAFTITTRNWKTGGSSGNSRRHKT